MEVLWILGAMLVLILLGLPIAYSMGLTATIALLLRQVPLQLVPQRMFTAVDSFVLLAVPLFIFVGEAMNTGGVTQRLFGFCRIMLGRVRGSLGHVNILASIIFAGMSGAAVADAAGLGAVEIKAMQEAGFDDDFSAAITAASSTIGPIIPPSIPLVLYAVLAEQSVGRLFLGGVIPGLFMGLALMAMVYIISKRKNYPLDPKVSWRDKGIAFINAFPSLLTPIIILWGIFGGVVSPTEAAALAAVYALFLGFVVHRELNLQMLYQIMKRTVVSSVKVLLIISSASILTWVVISSGAPKQIAAVLLSLTQNPAIMIILINILLLVLGCFLEATSLIMIMVPILLPLMQQMEYSLVAFGVVFVLNAMIGLITPPVGLCLYVTAGIVKLPISAMVKPITKFLIPLVFVLLLISLFPQIVTWLPDLIMGVQK